MLYKIQFFPTKPSGRVYRWNEASWEVMVYTCLHIMISSWMKNYQKPSSKTKWRKSWCKECTAKKKKKGIKCITKKKRTHYNILWGLNCPYKMTQEVHLKYSVEADDPSSIQCKVDSDPSTVFVCTNCKQTFHMLVRNST